MKKTKIDKQTLAQWWLRIYWAGLVVVLLSMMLQSVSIISGAKASQDDLGLPVPPDQQQANVLADQLANTSATINQQNASATVTNLTFQQYSCKIINYADPVIWSLVLLTIIIAGVIYAVSMGQTGGGELSIGLAKQMIVAALTGAVLYSLGSFLVGKCGDNQGGWISNLLKSATGTEQSNNTTDNTNATGNTAD